MLNGIGGRTVAEAKRSMSFQEAHKWAEYCASRGPINLSRRVDSRLARLELLFLRFMGDKKTKIEDLLPYEYEQRQEELATFEEAFALLQSATKH